MLREAVHGAGGRILLQLWHVGRISDPVFLDGALPVAPSAIAPAGTVSLVRPKRPFVTPRALDLDEIPAVVEAYRRGAENARRAVRVAGGVGNPAEQIDRAVQTTGVRQGAGAAEGAAGRHDDGGIGRHDRFVADA